MRLSLSLLGVLTMGSELIEQLKDQLPNIEDCIQDTIKISSKELASPCPGCGGSDRFCIFTETQRFYCRQCEIKGVPASGNPNKFHPLFKDREIRFRFISTSKTRAITF